MTQLKVLIASIFLTLFACGPSSDHRTSASQSPTASQEKPHALTKPARPSFNYAHGRINQVLVVADSSLWLGMPGDSLFYYFTAPYILLPQPEPIFDVTHITPEALSVHPAKKEFRTIVFLADLNDENSLTSRLVRADLGGEKILEIKRGKSYNTTIGQDKWARSQLLFYISGFGEDKLVENIAVNFPAIAKRINDKDAETVEATAYQAGRNPDLEADLMAKFGVRMRVPGNFRRAKFDEKNNVIWLRSDEREIIANILVTKVPYTDKAQLTKEGIKKLRDQAGKIITTRQPDTYMRINDVDLPLFVENKQLNNVYTVQARGIWDIVNDFMGGPFITHLMLNPVTNELVLVDGFIYAPSKDKRNHMQEMELIVSTARF